MDLHTHSLSLAKSFSSVARTSPPYCTKHSAAVFGAVFPMHFRIVRREEAVSRECIVNFGLTSQNDMWFCRIVVVTHETHSCFIVFS